MQREGNSCWNGNSHPLMIFWPSLVLCSNNLCCTHRYFCKGGPYPQLGVFPPTQATFERGSELIWQQSFHCSDCYFKSVDPNVLVTSAQDFISVPGTVPFLPFSLCWYNAESAQYLEISRPYVIQHWSKEQIFWTVLENFRPYSVGSTQQEPIHMGNECCLRGNKDCSIKPWVKLSCSVYCKINCNSVLNCIAFSTLLYFTLLYYILSKTQRMEWMVLPPPLMAHRHQGD